MHFLHMPQLTEHALENAAFPRNIEHLLGVMLQSSLSVGATTAQSAKYKGKIQLELSYGQKHISRLRRFVESTV